MMELLIIFSILAGMIFGFVIATWLIISVHEYIDYWKFKHGWKSGYHINTDNIFYKMDESGMRPFKMFKRTSPLQREIIQEEKEIKELERQKADMERLKSVKRRKEELFQEVNGEEDELNFEPIKEECHSRLRVYEVTVYEGHLPSLNTHSIRAESMNEAIEKFRRDNLNIPYFEIKEVM